MAANINITGKPGEIVVTKTGRDEWIVALAPVASSSKAGLDTVSADQFGRVVSGAIGAPASSLKGEKGDKGDKGDKGNPGVSLFGNGPPDPALGKPGNTYVDDVAGSLVLEINNRLET